MGLRPKPRDAGRNAPSEARVAEAQRAEPVGGASRRARTRQFCRVLASLNCRASVRDQLPSAGQGVRRGAGICRAQTACLSAAVYRVRVGAMPRTRQNCSARQFTDLSSAALSRSPPRHRRAPRHHKSDRRSPRPQRRANCRGNGASQPAPATQSQSTVDLGHLARARKARQGFGRTC